MRIALVALVLASCGPPSDQQMLDNLHAKRASFDALVRMIQQDPRLERVDNDWLHSWTRPEDLASIGVTKERLAEYHRLLAEANIPRGFYSFEGGAQITFVAHASGLSISGNSKSYLYTREEHPVGDPPLDSLHAQPKAAEVRRVEPHWSLEFTSN